MSHDVCGMKEDIKSFEIRRDFERNGFTVRGDGAGGIVEADTALEEGVEGCDVDSFAFFEDEILEDEESFVQDGGGGGYGCDEEVESGELGWSEAGFAHDGEDDEGLAEVAGADVRFDEGEEVVFSVCDSEIREGFKDGCCEGRFSVAACYGEDLET